MSLPSFFSDVDDDIKEFSQSSFEIQRCFDSHVHWQASGEFLAKGRLDSLGSVADWRQVSPARRGDWRLYFGWNPELSPNLAGLTAKILDENVPAQYPILVSHCSGHSGVVNQAGLEKLGWRYQEDLPLHLRPYAGSDSTSGLLTGCFFEAAHFEILRRLPPLTDAEFQQHLILGQDYFLSRGFTHIREMMAHPSLFDLLSDMESSGSLRCYADINLHLKDLSELTDYIQFIQMYRQRKPLSHIRLQGLKVFLDGSLGAGTAALSSANARGHDGSSQLLWSHDDFAELCDRSFSADIPLSVHSIGDQAMEMAIHIAERSAGANGGGQLNIEHGEIFDPSLLANIRNTDVRFHFQPSHFQADIAKLKTLFESHKGFVFPWRSVEDGGFKFFFGSDSPVGFADLRLTRQGLGHAKREGIRAIQGPWWRHHQHPDRHFGEGARSLFNATGETLAVFDGDQILFSKVDPIV